MQSFQVCGLGKQISNFILTYSSGNVTDLTEIMQTYDVRPDIIIEATEPPWEVNAMNAVHTHCSAKTADDRKNLVFYFHNKGASKYDPNWKEHLKSNYTFKTYANSLYWRKYMEYFTLERPHLCIDQIVNHMHPTCGVKRAREPSNHYSGNFWFTSCDYVATLPQCCDYGGTARSKYTAAESGSVKIGNGTCQQKMGMKSIILSSDLIITLSIQSLTGPTILQRLKVACLKTSDNVTYICG